MPKVLLIPYRDDLPMGVTQYLKLEDYQDYVGGYIEAATPVRDLVSGDRLVGRKTFVAFLNEDGIARNLQQNTRVAHLLGHDNGGLGFFGNAVVVGAADREGNETDVPEDVIEWAKTYMGTVVKT